MEDPRHRMRLWSWASRSFQEFKYSPLGTTGISSIRPEPGHGLGHAGDPEGWFRTAEQSFHAELRRSELIASASSTGGSLERGSEAGGQRRGV